MATREIYTLSAITATATTTTIAASGNYFLHTVSLPKTSAGAITFEDIAGSPATYFVLPAATIAGTYHFDDMFGNGLKVVTASADTVLISGSAI